MTGKLVPALVLVAALAGLGASIGWAVSQASDGARFSGPGGYSMMSGGSRPVDWHVDGSGAPVRDIAGARAQAARFASRLGLKTGEVMQFTENFYVLLEDRKGRPATEVLVDPRTGDVTLEYGPAMMWNTRYGMMSGASGDMPDEMMDGGMMGHGSSGGMMGDGSMMGDGMMGRYGGNPSWTPPSGSLSGPLTAGEAQRVADRWLADQQRGAVAREPDGLPGYYTFHTLRDGKVTGMLSVNERSGAVWYHWWHGRFVKMEE